MARLAEKETRKTAEESKKMMLASEEVKKDLEARIDMVEARASSAEAKEKLSQEALARMKTEVEQRITAVKDELIDLAMYRFWESTQNADISFMEDEAEGLLAKWKGQLEEEREVQSVTASGAVDGSDDIDDEASSRGLKLPKTHAMYAAEIEASLAEINEAVASEAAKDETRENPSEAANQSEAVKDTPIVEDAPPPQAERLYLYFPSLYQFSLTLYVPLWQRQSL